MLTAQGSDEPFGVQEQVNGVERAVDQYVSGLQGTDSDSFLGHHCDAEGGGTQHIRVVCSVAERDDAGWTKFLHELQLILAFANLVQWKAKCFLQCIQVAVRSSREQVNSQISGEDFQPVRRPWNRQATHSQRAIDVKDCMMQFKRSPLGYLYM